MVTRGRVNARTLSHVREHLRAPNLKTMPPAVSLIKRLRVKVT